MRSISTYTYLRVIAPLLLIAACGGAESDAPATGVAAGTGASAPVVGSSTAAAGSAAIATKPPVTTGTMAGTQAPTMPTTPVTTTPPATTPPVATTPPPATMQPSAAGAAAPAIPPAAGAAAPATPPAAGGLPASPESGPAPKIPEVMGECPEIKTGTIMVGGHRNVAITAGEGGKKGALVFYWHGTGSTAAGEIGRLPPEMIEDITSTGGIIAGFNGSGTAGGKGDCSGTGTHNIADFDAGDQLVACAVKNHGIDPRRIYSAGCSAGGLQTGCMGALRSSYMAAVAPNSGGVVSPQPWQDDHAPAVMTMHGAAGSDVVIVDFSNTSRTYDMSAKSHGSFVINCDHGGGHCGLSNELKNAYWQFFKDHPFGIEKSPWETALPAGVPDYCKVF